MDRHPTRLDPAFATAPELVGELGRRLRAQRLAKPLTQQELAARAGVSVGAIKTLESTGQTTLETFVRAAQALGLADAFADFMRPAPPASIAAMEQAQAPPRQRVRRRAAPRGPAPGSR